MKQRATLFDYIFYPVAIILLCFVVMVFVAFAYDLFTGDGLNDGYVPTVNCNEEPLR